MKRPRIFYGWYILGAGSLANALFGATRSYGAGLFLVPLISEFGWGRAQLSGAFSLARLENGVMGPVEGILIDRFGPRAMMLIGVPVAGIGFLLLARLSDVMRVTGLDSLTAFYIVWVLVIAMGDSIGIAGSVSTAIAHWFVRRRAMALALLSSGLTVGAALWTPLLGQVIEQEGWRLAATLTGIAILVTGIPAALVMRHRPEPYGWGPDGDPLPGVPQGGVAGGPHHGSGAAGERGPVAGTREEFTLGRAVRTRAFWILSFSLALRILVTSAVIVHIAALCQDLGMSTAEAAGMLSALALLSTGGRLVMGWLADRYEMRLVYMGALVCLVAGLVAVAFAEDVWGVWVFMVLFAPAYGGLATITPAFRAELFGVRAFASIGGAMGPVTTLGTISGPWFAGYVFDVTGSYRVAMLIFAGLSVVNLALISFLRAPGAEEGGG